MFPETHREALELRLSDAVLKGGFATKNLYYQSVWWLNRDTFGHARLTREVTDAWVSRRFAHAGHQFTLQAPELTAAEISGVPGADADSQEKVKLEVMERGSAPGAFTIKQDEHKYWSMQNGEILQKYQNLREQTMSLVQQLFGKAPDGEDSADGSGQDGQGDGSKTVNAEVELDSLAKLEEAHGIELKCNSEVANVELLLAKDQSVWLLASQDRSIPKHQTLGGYGTGQWVGEADSVDGFPLTIPSDKALVQIDEGSFNSESQGFSTLSVYKMLIRSEREKGIVEHKVSFLKVERKDDAAVECGSDGFNISVKQAMKFKCLRDPRASGDTEKVTSKNFFARTNIQDSDSITRVVRFRFERVAQTWKVQRPYCITSRGISMKNGKPVKVA